jgi:ATP-dependent DNA helicase DinG
MGGIDEQVRELLGPGGTLARRLPGYEHREGQLRFARAVSSALEQDGTLIGEAGTGIGKSFGYLVPAILLAEERGKPVVISTRTKALQEQLNAKDLPFLQAVLPMEFTWTVAVGRNNYVCMRRFERAKKDRGTLFRDESHYEQLEAIAQLTAGAGNGTRDELGFVPKSSLWDEVCAEQGNCLGRKCRYYTPCPWQKSRRRLHNAQLLVVNHALYFADLALREHDVSLLPEHAAVIFDEAHHLEDIAGQALGRQLSGGMFEWVLSRLLTRSGRRGLLARHDPGLWQPVLGDLRGHVELWFGQVGHLAGSEGEARTLPQDSPFEDSLSEPLLSCAKELTRWAERELGLEERMELDSRVRRLEELASLVQSFCSKGGDNEVRWTERRRQQDVLCAAPVRVAPLLAEQLWGKDDQAKLLVSATLGPPDREFGWLRDRLGIVSASALREPSPFPYEENVRLEIPGNLPDPGLESRAFETESAELILEHCLANEGRALVLGTSRRWLDRCRQIIEGRLHAENIELLVQGDAPLPQLIERKREHPRSVLMGVDTLWEGIDIPGPAVTLLVLVRLPFAVPSHPLTKARIDEIARRGGNAFAEFSVPQALLKFQQGFGRLVRRHGDGGVVLALDPRLRTKPYGRRFVDVLPRCARS